jgi:hypothetical protein
MQTVPNMTGGVENTPPRLNLPVAAAPPLIPWRAWRRFARASVSLLHRRAAAIWPRAAVIALAIVLAPSPLSAELGTCAVTAGGEGGNSAAVLAFPPRF